MRNKTLGNKIKNLKRQKLVTEKVIKLDDFRKLKASDDTKTILIVDDDQVARSTLQRILHNDSYHTLVAKDGLELSTIIESTHFDLVILDINLPWVDGLQLCSIIKNHFSLQKIPIILMSTRKELANLEKGLNVGADNYITKPFEVEYILKIIHEKFFAPDDSI